jgi:thiamine transporter
MEKSDKRAREGLPVKALVEAAVMVALATVLSVMVVYRAPQGGSITPASMVPLLVLALRRGPRVGLLAGAVYGLIQLWMNPFVVHWVQVVLDYPLPFALLGLAGFFARWPAGGVVVGILGRLGSHVVSGVVFFGSYAPSGVNVWAYSLAYNASYLLPEMALSLIVVSLLNVGTRGRLLRTAP